MAALTLKDFSVGDRVFHLSNPNLAMVAIAIEDDKNEISCRWTDKNGKMQTGSFMPQELGIKKASGGWINVYGAH